MAQTIGFNDLNKQPNQPNQPGQQPNKPKGTGFTNLSRVLGANQNNKLGQAVGGGLQQTAVGAKQGVNQAQEQFQQKTQESLGQATGARQQALQNLMEDPSKVGEQQYNQFDVFRQGNYGGPNELANKQQLVGRAQEAEQLGGLVGSEGGRGALLQRYAAKNKPYTQGQMGLDQVILGQSAQPQLKEARRATYGLGNIANRGVTQAEQQAQQQQKQFAEQTGQQVEGTRTQAEQNANDELQREKNLWLQVNNIRGQSNAGEWADKGLDLTADQAKQLGLQEGDELTRSTWDVINRGGFNEGDINKYNTASAQDFARQQALARLAGKAYSDTDWAGKEAEANKFQQGFGVQDRGALQAAAQRDKQQVQAYADPIKAFAGDFDYLNKDSLNAALERGGTAAREARERADRAYNDALNNSGYNEALSRSNRFIQDPGLATAKARNDEATSTRNAAYARSNAYEDQKRALLSKLAELGVGRKLHIKDSQ